MCEVLITLVRPVGTHIILGIRVHISGAAIAQLGERCTEVSAQCIGRLFKPGLRHFFVARNQLSTITHFLEAMHYPREN